MNDVDLQMAEAAEAADRLDQISRDRKLRPYMPGDQHLLVLEADAAICSQGSATLALVEEMAAYGIGIDLEKELDSSHVFAALFTALEAEKENRRRYR